MEVCWSVESLGVSGTLQLQLQGKGSGKGSASGGWKLGEDDKPLFRGEQETTALVDALVAVAVTVAVAVSVVVSVGRVAHC